MLLFQSWGKTEDICTPRTGSSNNGKVSLEGELLHVLPDVVVTLLKLMMQNGKTIVWIGDHNGVIYKVGFYDFWYNCHSVLKA